jgi:uncharacterized protein with HEPN domain
LNRDKVYLKHILESIRRIKEDVQGGGAVFRSNRTIQDAVLRNLQVLSESTQRLSQASKSAYPEIPWRDIANFRNRVVHDYLNVDLDIVWEIIEHNLPPLEKTIREMRDKMK